MIKLLLPVPRHVCIAFSGGVDSVAVADFLRRNHKLKLLFVHHNTPTSDNALLIAKHYSTKWKLPLQVHYISADKPKAESQEEFWRNQRYAVFEQQCDTVITCHHLDDSVETWVWSSMHGCGKIIPATRSNIIRPFLTTRKQQLVQWCVRNKLIWSEDASNQDTAYTRNYIRHVMMPHVLRVNPGIYKTIRKKYA
jgi:tRNA(Ile)-lysidine synthase